jgi:hypothetical protein
MDSEACFVIDVGDSSLFIMKLKDFIYNNLSQMCICYHNKDEKIGNSHDIIYNRKFKLFFKFNQTIYNTLIPIQCTFEYLKVEIDFRRYFTVVGYHRSLSGSNYKFIGGRNFSNLAQPHDNFIEMLLQISRELPLQPRSRNSFYYRRNTDLREVKNIIEAYTSLYGTSASYKIKDLKDVYRFETDCPFSNLHTSPSKSTDFNITFKRDTRTLMSGCWHKSCKASLHEFIKDFVAENRSKTHLQRIIEDTSVTACTDTNDTTPVSVAQLDTGVVK